MTLSAPAQHLRQASWQCIRSSPGAHVAPGFNQYANKAWMAALRVRRQRREGRREKAPCSSSLGDFNSMGRFSITLSYFCCTPAPQAHSNPFVSPQDSSLSCCTHAHPTSLACCWLRKVISSINQSSESPRDEPIKGKVLLSSFLSPPSPLSKQFIFNWYWIIFCNRS